VMYHLGLHREPTINPDIPIKIISVEKNDP